MTRTDNIHDFETELSEVKFQQAYQNSHGPVTRRSVTSVHSNKPHVVTHSERARLFPINGCRMRPVLRPEISRVNVCRFREPWVFFGRYP